MPARDQALYDHDVRVTLANRESLQKNQNLMYWYGQLYGRLFSGIADLNRKTILEIGSGASPLKYFYPQVVTTDVLALEYLDHVFDCHEIDSYKGISDHSIDILTLTNVLHHLRDPLHFLANATKKLKPGGWVILVEPYFSALSYPIYKLLHHEPVDFSVREPRLDGIEGPLSTSNQAIPYKIFFTMREWRERLSGFYDLSMLEIQFFSSLSYMLTGGISHRLPVPGWFYRRYFAFDRRLADLAPTLFASFFIARIRALSAQ